MKFIFGIHNHQPVGNFDHVIEDAYQRAYHPFLDLIEQFPFLHFSMHVSGPLIEWLEKYHPGYIDRISRWVSSGNIEILSSGFYEPILASISDEDKIGQIKMMNEYINQRFGKYPEGLWLTERVWEPGLVKPISLAGIKYIAVDDTHFSTSGIPTEKLKGYYLTEDQGYMMGVFPISQQLRYTIPFRPPTETIDILSKFSNDDEAVLVMADDGEKFGVWPGTYDHCFGHTQWLKSFLTVLESNRKQVQSVTFSEVFHAERPLGRVYLPTSSYFEMGEWTLTPELNKKFDQVVEKLTAGKNGELKPFIKGGYWRNFLTRYAESNWMLKRVNHASFSLAGNDKKVRQSIWRAQCNCAFWHGIFGGLYLPHLRHAIFENLIDAEKHIHHEPVESYDIDHDGVKEIVLSGKNIRVFCSPIGGAIRELDFLPANFNIMNTLSRYEEHYHAKLLASVADDKNENNVSIHNIVHSKEEGLEDLLFYDSHPRWSAMDKFFPEKSNLPDVKSGKVKDLGSFTDALNTTEIDGRTIRFTARGKVSGNEAEIRKSVSLDGDMVQIAVEIKNCGKKSIVCRYSCEFNFSFLGGHTPDRYYLIDGIKPFSPEMDSSGIVLCNEIVLITDWENLRCTLKFEESTELWRYPVETVNMSESGFERVYQCSSVMPVWVMDLKPQDTFSCHFSLGVSSYK